MFDRYVNMLFWTQKSLWNENVFQNSDREVTRRVIGGKTRRFHVQLRVDNPCEFTF